LGENEEQKSGEEIIPEEGKEEKQVDKKVEDKTEVKVDEKVEEKKEESASVREKKAKEKVEEPKPPVKEKVEVKVEVPPPPKEIKEDVKPVEVPPPVEEKVDVPPPPKEEEKRVEPKPPVEEKVDVPPPPKEEEKRIEPKPLEQKVEEPPPVKEKEEVKAEEPKLPLKEEPKKEEALKEPEPEKAEEKIKPEKKKVEEKKPKKEEKKEEKPKKPKRSKPSKAEGEDPFQRITPLVFGKYDLREVEIEDPGLRRYVNLTPVGIPHTGAKHANRWFGKRKVNIVERLINNMMRTKHTTGKKAFAYRTVNKAFDIIAKRTKKNPVQVFVFALQNSSPKEEITRLRFGGISVPKAVDTSSARKLDIALRNICKGAVSASHRNRKRMEMCLAEEIILASKADMNSFAVSKKEELERIAASAR
jgi:small subunit ribosomal protein S7